MGLLLISMVLLGGYLMTRNHTSGQKDTDHPKKANKNAPSTNSSITEKQLTNQKTTFRELTDFEKKEIRNITLSIVQPVYQQTIEPIVDCVIRGDYDSKQSYITKNGELTRFVV